MSSPSRVAVAASVLVVGLLVACGSLDSGAEPSSPAQPALTQDPTAPPAIPQAVALVAAIVVAETPAELPDYDRDDWKHWTDVDGDCQNTRQEVLIEESSTSVEFEDNRMCRVESGSWTDPYTGILTEDPSDLDIDHLVPLANAHDSGGHAWSKDRKEQFANHLPFEGHLVAATASANRSKGRKGPEEWRPSDRGYWCQYAVDWIAVKREWGLTATRTEVDALREMLDTCEHASILQTSDAGVASETPSSPTPAPVKSPTVPSPVPALSLTPTSSAEAAIDGEQPDQNCSDFERWEDAQRFFEKAGGPGSDSHGLDKDGNGIACESLPGSPGSTPVPDGSPTPAASAEPAPVATVQPSPNGLLYDPEGPDRNCSDFERWEDAQRFFEAAGGPDSDPHRLDRDRNGTACESLPGGPG